MARRLDYIVPAKTRLLAKVKPGYKKLDLRGRCWLFTGVLSPKGYGKFYYLGGARQVHRVAYELFVGPIPDGYEIDHLCRVRHCVNPDHLEAVTPLVNHLRGNSPPKRNRFKTRCARGHRYAGKNLYVTSRGWRQCNTCRRMNQERYAATKGAGSR